MKETILKVLKSYNISTDSLGEVISESDFDLIAKEIENKIKNLDEATEVGPEQVKRLLSDVLSLLKIQEDYINFLSEYANKHSEYLRVHGITPTKEELEKGKSMRDTAKIYGKKVFEDGKLIERVKIKTLNG